MTVAELIEELKNLPGDPDLRWVVVQAVMHRPYAAEVTVECNILRVDIAHDIAQLSVAGYLE